MRYECLDCIYLSFLRKQESRFYCLDPASRLRASFAEVATKAEQGYAGRGKCGMTQNILIHFVIQVNCFCLYMKLPPAGWKSMSVGIIISNQTRFTRWKMSTTSVTLKIKNYCCSIWIWRCMYIFWIKCGILITHYSLSNIIRPYSFVSGTICYF